MRCSRPTTLGILSAALYWAALCSAPSVGSADETKDARRARLEKMRAVEKDELRRNHHRLEQLTPDQQRPLRELEHQLASDPQGDQLRKVMLRYHEWLRALPSAERADLLALSDNQERISKIKSMLSQQETERFRELAKESLTPKDVEQVRAWLSEMVMLRKSDLLQQLPEDVRNRLSESQDARRFMAEWFAHTRDRNKSPVPITDALKILDVDRQRLVEKLSPKARDVYKQAGNNEQDKRTVFQNWVFATFRPPRPSTEELQNLLQRLPPEIRDRVENLPPEQMKAELTKIFYDSMRRGHPDGKRPGDRFPGPGGSDSRKGPPGKRGVKSEKEKPEK